MLNYHASMQTLLTLLDDAKASDITVIDVHEQTSITDFMIIVTGRSNRHVQAIAKDAMEKMKALDIPTIGQHGMESADWVLIDFGEMILHVMQEETRAFYKLEELWQATTS